MRVEYLKNWVLAVFIFVGVSLGRGLFTGSVGVSIKGPLKEERGEETVERDRIRRVPQHAGN